MECKKTFKLYYKDGYDTLYMYGYLDISCQVSGKDRSAVVEAQWHKRKKILSDKLTERKTMTGNESELTSLTFILI